MNIGEFSFFHNFKEKMYFNHLIEKVSKKPIFFVLLIFLVTSACKTNSNKEKELEQKENELAQRESELNQKEIEIEARNSVQQSTTTNPINVNDNFNNETQESLPIGETKYVYVKIQTNEPELETLEIPDHHVRGSFDDLFTPIESPRFAVPRFYTYTSDIFEITDFTEDKKYQTIDQFEKSVRYQLSIADMNFISKNMGANPSKYHAEATIVSKQAFVFNSYREASENR